MVNTYVVCDAGHSMTKSQSMPCHVTTMPPDPFPELSRHNLRLYRFQDVDTASTSGTTELGRMSPDATSSMMISDMSVGETLSTPDNVTQVSLMYYY